MYNKVDLPDLKQLLLNISKFFFDANVLAEELSVHQRVTIEVWIDMFSTKHMAVINEI